MKILLLGTTGQLGRELLPRLSAVGTVVLAARPRADGALEPGQYAFDLADTEGLRRLVRAVGPDLIVNAAAYTAVDAAESCRAAADAANHVGPGVLAEEAARQGAALLHYSTDYVFSGEGAHAWTESDRCEPLNYYGQSKLAGEEAIRASGSRHLILRTSWLYGPWGRNFVKTMLRLAHERDEISVVGDQCGAPTSTRFLAEATARIVAQARDDQGYFDRHGGTLHAACAGETTWHGFACEIFAQAAELDIAIPSPSVRMIASAEFPTPARRPSNSRLATRKLSEQYGIQPPPWDAELKVNLREIMAEQAANLPAITAR